MQRHPTPPGDVIWRHGAPLPPDQPMTLPGLIAGCADRLGDAVVLIDVDGRRCSWRDLDRWSGRLAWHWRERVQPGDRIAIIAANGLPHLLAELAAWRLAAIVCPISAAGGPGRVAQFIALSAPRLIVADDPGGIDQDAGGSPIESAAGLVASADRPGRELTRPASADMPCLILSTSGSGGAARGAVLSHGNLCSQQAAFAMIWPEVGPGDRLAAYLPWHHSFGALAERLWALTRGATLSVVPGGGRDRDRLLATVRAVRPTVFMSVPKMHGVLAEADAFDRSVLRWAFTAGAPIAARVERWYADRGIPLYEGWGLTECSPSCTITMPGPPRVPGVVGHPIPGVAVGVRPGDGRILVRGPNVMLGWWDGSGIDSAPVRDGILDSGDEGEWTGHGLRLRGRADHVLKLANGEPVPVAGIEARLHAHAGVVHAVVDVDEDLIALIEGDAHGADEALRAVVEAVNRGIAVPYQRIARAYRLDGSATVADGLLTPSWKVVRRAWRDALGRRFRRIL